MKDIEVLRRMAKKGISFPKQTPQPFELFGVRCIAIGFYRGEEKRLLLLLRTLNLDSIMDIR